MPSNLKVIQSHNFSGGMTSDLAPEVMEPNQYRYMLNCNVLSTSEGNVGILTNVKGTIEIPVPLPDGLNRAIGWGADEETNNLYFAVYNSLGYHGWYRYNSIDNAVIKIMECITDTGGTDIFGWSERDRILHINIIENNLLYWTVISENEHPARKINISKALDRTPTGYNGVIKEEYTRAYKKTAPYPPRGKYFTDTTKEFNRVYGRLFKFAVRFGYDDKEWSNWSSFSDVAVPDFERYSGALSIPAENNGIEVTFDTGGFLVTKIELAVMSTNPEGGTMPWVSIEVLEKDKLGITDNSEYTYKFYNDVSTSAIGDQQKVYRLYSYLPKDPKCQEFTDNALLYANFHEGFPVVPVDVDTSVRYDDIFIDDSEENELNDPSIELINISYDYVQHRTSLFTVDKFKAIAATLVIGPDVKKGNLFSFILYDSKKNPRYSTSVTAGFSDTARTVATKFANKFRESLLTSPNSFPGFETVGDVTVDVGGNALFSFKWWNAKDAPQPSYSTSVNPVETNSLKNAGQSINNIKLGSSVGYAIVYMDKDGRKSAAYRVDGMTVAIDSINKLGGLKKPVVELTIHHSPPEWAYFYQIVRTDDLVYGNYIQMLIQKTVAYNEGSDEYVDLVIGSLFTYQRIHPNTTLQYEFKRGDRVRIVSNYDGSDWVVPPVAKDFEVLAYFPSVEDVIDSDIEVDGSSSVKVSETSTDHIGSFIRVNGAEREIISVTDSTHYELNDNLSSGDPSNTTKTFPSYEIINRRGVIRIKNDPDNPIVADPDNNIFPLVEIYSPSVGTNSADEDMFSEFGLVLPIINPGTAAAYHAGTTQDQDISQPAIIEVSSGTSYVRYRELPVNNDIDNPQVLVGQVEDPSYSDFYVSDMNGNGKRIPLDRGDGEVLFDERIRFSNSYIEGTRINGLNDFDNLDRGDYNDKYGAIERIWYEEGRLYVFKHGKDTWLPIYAAIITDQGGNPLLAKSDKLLADKLQYYAWDGGVGDNPESVARLGTNFFHVSPNSMIVARIGGNGVDDISRIYSLDKDVRDHLTSAKKAQAHIYGGTDRKNGKYDVIIEKHDNVISDTPISESGWINEVEELPTSGVTYSLVSGPSHGTANVSGSVIDYTPDTGYSGPDTMQYEVFVGGVSQGIRNVCLTVVYQEGPKAWRPIDPFCVLENGARTGYKGWSTLEEYDTYHGTATGVTKPNAPSDPDYVAPVYDIVSCPPQSQFLLFKTNDSGVSTNIPIWFNRFSGSISGQAMMVSVKDGVEINQEVVPVGTQFNFDVMDTSVSVYFRADVGVVDQIKEFDVRPPASQNYGITNVYPEIFPTLEVFGVYNQSLNNSSEINSSLAALPTLKQILIYRNNLSGNLNVSSNTAVESLEFFENDYTSLTGITNLTILEYYNSAGNNNLAGTLDLSNAASTLHTVIAFRNNWTDINIDGCYGITTFDVGHNQLLSESYDFTLYTGIEFISVVNCPITDLIWGANTTVKGIYIANSSIPESRMHAGISSNKSTLEAVQISSQGSYTGPFDLSNCPNLGFLWLDDLPNCTGFDISNTGGISNLNIAGMHMLTSMPSLGSNPLNGLVWLTGSGISPSDVDAVLIYISGLNIPPADEFHAGPGAIIYGDYETTTGTITPTSASLAAYNDLISRGYTIIGPVPGS